MSLNIPLILKGKHFSLCSEFSKDSEGSLVIVDNPIIFRGVVDHTNSVYLDCTQFSSDLSNNRLSNISSKLQSNLAYLQLDFWGLKYLSSFGERREYKIESDKLIEILDKYKHIDIDRYKFSMLQLPYVLAPLEEDKVIFNLIDQIIDKADLSIDDLDMLVLSGEMIWSGFINSFILVNILNRFKIKKLYLILDQTGIWQGLLNIKEPKELRLINKKYLMPQVLFQTVSSNEKYILLKSEDDNRRLYLINNLNVFDLGLRQSYINDLLLPRYLIIKKDLKDIKKKDLVHVSTDILKQGRGVFKIIPQNIVRSLYREVNLGNTNVVNCSKKVGDWVNLNETIGRKIISRYDTYRIEKEDKVKVFDGQIVKKGDVLFKRGILSQVRLKNPGRVDLSLKDKDILRVILNEKEDIFSSPFVGEFRGLENSGAIRIKSSFLNFKLSYSIGREAWGVLSNKSGATSAIILCDDFNEAYKYLVGEAIHSIYYIDQINGILIKKISFSDLIRLKSIKIPNFNVGVISIENDLYLNLWGKLEKEILDRPVIIEKDNLFFQLDKCFTDKYIFEEQDKKNYILNIGDYVNFVDLKTSNLYGKIIKSKSRSQKSFIINNKEDLININIRNIIKFKNGE